MNQDYEERTTRPEPSRHGLHNYVSKLFVIFIVNTIQCLQHNLLTFFFRYFGVPWRDARLMFVHMQTTGLTLNQIIFVVIVENG